MQTWRAIGIALAATLAVGCGARSQLRAPDLGEADATDVALGDAIDAHDAADVRDAADARDVGLAPIDPGCPDECPYTRLAPSFPPFVPLARPDVPASCANGFELGGANGGCGHSTYTLLATRAGGARAITLDVDFATYLVPDGVTLTGVDGAGNTYTLLRSCRLRTSLVGGPSTMRPPDNTIRQFRVPVREGTTRLDFDFGAVTSPMYIQVLGLCDFAVTRFPHAAWWQAVP